MKIDDLRTMLDEQADEAGTAGTPPHVAVRSRIRRRARVRAAGAVAAAVVAVAAGALVVPNLTDAGRPVSPAASTTPSPAIVGPSPSTSATPGRLDMTVFGVFPAKIDGSALLRTFAVTRGKTTGTFTVDVPPAGVGYAVQCVIPEGSGLRAEDVMLHIRENGEDNIAVSCDSDLRGMNYVTSENEPAAGPATITLELTAKGKPVSVSQARIAVGVYSSDHPKQTKNGFTVPVIKGSPPNEGTLHSFDTLMISAGHRKLSVRVPASTEPIQISYTASGAVSDGTVALVVPDGGEYSISGGGGGTVTVDPGPARTVSLSAAADQPHPNAAGKLAIAVYLTK
jgi:hypothetical protein